MKRNTNGFTLIELAVVLAIIAVLAAVLTPVVTGYLEQARVSRAAADVRTIADAIKLYKEDTGVYPFFDSVAAANSGQTADIAGNKQMVASNGGDPIASQSAVTSGTTLETYLNGNVMGRPADAKGGRAKFNGPYTAGIEADAWGNKYYVVAGNLGSNSANWAFVVSAGPNAAIDTSKTQPKTGTFTVGVSDDIATIIH